MANQDKPNSNTFRYDPHFLASYQTHCNSDGSLSRMKFNVKPEDITIPGDRRKEEPVRHST